MTDTNVNAASQLSTEVNIKRLGQQQKDILCFLYGRRDCVWKQTEIIEKLYDGVTDSRKASVSRSMKKLREAGIVGSRQAYPSPFSDGWIKQRIRFFLTESGRRFVEEDERLPPVEEINAQWVED